MTSHPPVTTRADAPQIVVSVGAPAHGGHCVARPVDDPDGPVVFVRHALPGETVRAAVTHRKSSSWHAEAIEILEASPDRVRPIWAEAGPGGVGGGELGHVRLSAQRTWKQWVLADCLRRIGGQWLAEAVAALPEASDRGGVIVEAMPSERAAEASADGRARLRAGTATRTRVSLTVTEQGEAGMHGYRSAAVLPVRSLPLAVAGLQGLGLTERNRWRRRYRPGMRINAVAPAVGEPLVLLDGAVHTAAARPTGRRRVDELVAAVGLGLDELRYSVHADGFWQVHRDAPAVLVDRVVRAALSPEPTGAGSRPGQAPLDARDSARTRVLDLYSGAGLFTLPLALLAGTVHSLEGSEQAVRDARRTIHAVSSAGLHTGRVTAGTVAGLAQLMEDGPDVVVLDPPRKGAGRAVVRAVAATGARRIVLVACDPAALARDLAEFLSAGYRLGALSALDMFPHTHHFETIAVLDRP